MMYLLLFWTFFKVGLFTFGGGYAMIPLLRQELSVNHAWLEEEQFAEFVGISESTPGPFAVNIATFSGYHVMEAEGSPLLGSLCATFGLVLPSLLVILAIAALFRHVMRHWAVRGALDGVKPVVVALIGAAALSLAWHALCPENTAFRWGGALLAGLLFALSWLPRVSVAMLLALGAAAGLLTHGLGWTL